MSGKPAATHHLQATDKSLQQSAGVIGEVECESKQVANVAKLQQKSEHHIACMGEGIVHDNQLLPNIDQEGKPSTQYCQAAMQQVSSSSLVWVEKLTMKVG